MKKNINLLPADTYTVVNKTTINETDKKIITMLYQPIIGYSAVSLYLMLINDLDKNNIMSKEYTHHHLITNMQLKLSDILIAREKLEGVGLLKTYLKSNNINNYVYMLYSPLDANSFFNHPILNVVLYNNLGKQEYNELLSYFKIPRIVLKDYDEITKSFNEVYHSVPSVGSFENEDIIKKNTNNLVIDKTVDFDMIMASIPKSMINDKCFTKDVKQLINSLVFAYNISQEAIISLIRDSLNEKGIIDKTLLRKNCRNYYQFDNIGALPTLVYRTQPEFLKKPTGDNSNWAKMVYTFENVSPYDYLKSKYGGIKPTTRDLKLIENLLIDQKLSPGVVNVLIAYVLKINNQKLSKNYIETIVGQWKRLNIETVEEAMKLTEKEYKKMHKKAKPSLKTTTVKTKDIVPDWFDKNLDNIELSEEEEKELNSILESIV